MSKSSGSLAGRRMRRKEWKAGSKHWCCFLEGISANKETMDEFISKGFSREELIK